jgi:hypothetical protein
MCDLCLEVRGQVDDVDGIEGAFLGADTTSNAQTLRDEGDFGRVCDFDAQLARADNRARLLAFLSAFLGFVSWSRRRVEGGTCLGLALPWRTCSC